MSMKGTIKSQHVPKIYVLVKHFEENHTVSFSESGLSALMPASSKNELSNIIRHLAYFFPLGSHHFTWTVWNRTPLKNHNKLSSCFLVLSNSEHSKSQYRNECRIMKRFSYAIRRSHPSQQESSEIDERACYKIKDCFTCNAWILPSHLRKSHIDNRTIIEQQTK